MKGRIFLSLWGEEKLEIYPSLVIEFNDVTLSNVTLLNLKYTLSKLTLINLIYYYLEKRGVCLNPQLIFHLLTQIYCFSNNKLENDTKAIDFCEKLENELSDVVC